MKETLDEQKMHDLLTFDESLIIKDEFQERSGENEVVKRERIQSRFYFCRTCIKYLI